MAVPYTFGTATASIPLSNLDANFATTITLGNTAVQLGNTVTTLNNMTLANVTVSSGNVTFTNVSATTANVTTANIGTAIITGTTTLTNLTASTALSLDASKNIASVTNTGTGSNVLSASPTLTGTAGFANITASGTLGVTGVATFSAGTAALPAITTTGDTNTGIFFPAADTIAFSEGGAEAMRITSAGNVGIGSLGTYEAKLKVSTANGASDFSSSGINICGAAEITSGQVLPISFTPIGNDSTRARAAIGCVVGANWGFGNLGFYTRAAADASVLTTADERMRIDSSGNVGIGTSSPSAKLSVAGTATITGLTTLGSATATPIQIDRLSDSTSYGLITLNGALTNATAAGILGKGTGGDAGNLYYTSPTNHVFQIAAVEKMRIDSSGNLNIGDSGNFGGKISLAFNPATQNGLIFGVSSATFTNNYVYFQNSGGSKIGSVSSDNSSVTYNTTSDYRIKTNVQPITGALAKVAQLNPVTYDWKPEFSEGSSQGFIAHELQAVVPECVTGKKDELDEKGKPKYQGIDTSFLVATLTAAIQEQQALITSLTARIAALESN